MAVELATAYVSLTASAKGITQSIQGELGDPLERAGDQAGDRSSRAFGTKFKSGLASAAKVGAVALAAGLAGAAVFGKQSIDAASDLAESMSKVDVVFGDSAGAVIDWSKNSASAFGASQQAALEAAGTYGNLFQAFGVGQQPAKDMSTTLVGLAADLASFNNTSTDEAIEALRSGLSGETEPLKKYGVALSDARLKTKALELGLISNTKDALDPATKSQAAYALIMQDSTLAQGDFARTSTGLANKQRILAAQFQNIKAKIGNVLIPAFSAVVGFLTDTVLPALPKVAKAFGFLFDDDGAYGFAEVMDNVFGNSGKLIPLFEKFGVVLRGVFFGLRTAFFAVRDFIVDNWDTIKSVVASIGDAFVAAFDGIKLAVQWVIDNKPVLIGVLTGIGAALAALFISWAAGAVMAAIATLAAALPFILVGVAIAALTAGVIYAYQNWEWFRTAVDAVAAFMRDVLWPALQDVFNWMRDNIPVILAAIADFVTTKVIPAFQSFWSFLQDSVWPILKTIAEVVMTVVIVAFDAMVVAVTAVWGWLQTLWDRSEGLRGFLADAFTAGVNVAKDAFNTMRDAISNVWDWLQQMWDRAEGVRGFLAGAFWLAVTLVQTAFDNVVSVVTTVWSWLQTLWDKSEEVRSFFAGAFDTALGVLEDGFGFLKDAIAGVRDAIQWVIDKANAALGPLQKVIDLANKVFGLDITSKVSDTAFTGGIPPRANGGPVLAGHSYIVGERRPELFVPDQDGTIVPRVPSSFGQRGVNIEQANFYDATDLDGFARVMNFALAGG